MPYRKLQPDKMIETTELLAQRIQERFPGSGLLKVCHELVLIARMAKARGQGFNRHSYWLWAAVGLALLLLFSSLAGIVMASDMPRGGFSLGDFVTLSDSALNVILVMGAGILFLLSLEKRLKRKRALEAIYELRAIGHVIDMHQLTKDPSRLKDSSQETPSSPKLELSAYQLTRYLDYCSEMLSQTGKFAALYAQNFTDEVVLSAVKDVEHLTTGMSRKIWQKIMILNTVYREE